MKPIALLFIIVISYAAQTEHSYTWGHPGSTSLNWLNSEIPVTLYYRTNILKDETDWTSSSDAFAEDYDKWFEDEENRLAIYFKIDHGFDADDYDSESEKRNRCLVCMNVDADGEL